MLKFTLHFYNEWGLRILPLISCISHTRLQSHFRGVWTEGMITVSSMLSGFQEHFLRSGRHGWWSPFSKRGLESSYWAFSLWRLIQYNVKKNKGVQQIFVQQPSVVNLSGKYENHQLIEEAFLQFLRYSVEGSNMWAVCREELVKHRKLSLFLHLCTPGLAGKNNSILYLLLNTFSSRQGVREKETRTVVLRSGCTYSLDWSITRQRMLNSASL